VSEDGILIIGATGTLGSRIVDQMATAGSRPRVLVRTPAQAAQIEPYATPFVGDLLEPVTLESAFRGADRVFVLGQPTEHMEALERNAIGAAAAASAQRIVYLSNFTASLDSELAPNRIHARHERMVASLGVEWTVLGPTRYMTNVPFDWDSVLNDGVLRESGGAGIMTCVDPDDVAEVAIKALTEDGHSGRTYRLTSQDSFTADQLAALISSVIGRTVRVAEDGAAVGYFKLVAEGRYFPTDTAAEVLGRPPHAYRDWLIRNVPTATTG
jgi:uncharacterized protein YbjT (DUF2867 family)